VSTLKFSVSLHDVAPATWPECQDLLRLLDQRGVPATLLVVPDYHGAGRADADPDFVECLRARVRSGDEIVLHGFRHRDDGPTPVTLRDWWQRRVLTDAEGEMAALSSAEAGRRIAAGLDVLAAAELNATGFVAPAWLLSREARQALQTSRLAYTATRDCLIRLPDLVPVAAPSLVYSSRNRWRRIVSRVWNRSRLALLKNAPLIRVALHPIDARHPSVVREWGRMLDLLSTRRSAVLESRWLNEHAVA
jgi:predicted deacetylase